MARDFRLTAEYQTIVAIQIQEADEEQAEREAEWQRQLSMLSIQDSDFFDYEELF